MLTGQSLVYFAPGPWDDLWRPQHQLMSVFARQNKVLYVERRRYLRPTVAAFRNGDLGWSDVRSPALEAVADGLYVHRHPVWAPLSGAFALKQITRTITRASLHRSMRVLQLSDPIVWYSLPGMLDMMDDIPSASLRLYHAMDEYTSYGAQTADRRRVLEQRA